MKIMKTKLPRIVTAKQTKKYVKIIKLRRKLIKQLNRLFK
jgi:hypothetical protein